MANRRNGGQVCVHCSRRPLDWAHAPLAIPGIEPGPVLMHAESNRHRTSPRNRTWPNGFGDHRPAMGRHWAGSSVLVGRSNRQKLDPRVVCGGAGRNRTCSLPVFLGCTAKYFRACRWAYKRDACMRPTGLHYLHVVATLYVHLSDHAPRRMAWAEDVECTSCWLQRNRPRKQGSGPSGFRGVHDCAHLMGCSRLSLGPLWCRGLLD